MSQKKFAAQRQEFAEDLYREYNTRAFDGRLPEGMTITWSKTLNTTAGRTLLIRKGQVYSAEIELSTKVVDSMAKLRNTLCHEMCHAAAWLVNGVSKPPHGKIFKGWAAKAMRRFPDLDITTCHSYQINYKFQWQCETSWCRKIYGRHSKSIDTTKQGCGACSGRLNLLPKLNADGTPRKARKPTAFSLHVKDNFGKVKRANPGSTHGDIMKLLSAQFKSLKH